MIAQLTDSLAARLSAAEYTTAYPSVVAQKAYLPYYDNDAMTSLRVTVVPRQVEVMPWEGAVALLPPDPVVA